MALETSQSALLQSFVYGVHLDILDCCLIQIEIICW